MKKVSRNRSRFKTQSKVSSFKFKDRISEQVGASDPQDEAVPDILVLLRFLMKQCGGASGLVSIPIIITIPIAHDYIYNVFVQLLYQLLTITITTCLQGNFQPVCSYLRSCFAHGTPQPRTCRGLQKIVQAPFVLKYTSDNVHDFAKNVPALFFSIVPEIMSMAPGWMSCPWRSWTWQIN